MRQIVVPLDHSTLAERAVGIARTVAAETGASIRLIAVAPSTEVGPTTAYLASVAKSLLPGSEPEVEVIDADIGESVADCLLGAVGTAASDTLVCMSTHGRSGIGSALMGSTAEDVLRCASQPVLLLGHRCELPWPGHRRGLLVPIDGSDRSHELLAPVAEMVNRSGLQPIVVKVAHSFDVEDAHDPMAGLEEAGRILADLGVEAKLVHRFASNVPIALTEAAREWGAALIVMASYVKPGAARTLVGSVTMRTIHEAPCPVLVYPRMVQSQLE
jgi:nucleotide-binding universal stress UspA family protein